MLHKKTIALLALTLAAATSGLFLLLQRPAPAPETGPVSVPESAPAPSVAWTSERFRDERLKRPDASDEVSLFAVGDIMPGRGVARFKARQPEGWLLGGIAEAAREADVAVANLEAPIAAGAPVPDDSMRLRADPGIEREIAAAGFDLLSLANNHALDAGVAGLQSTRALVEAAGMRHVGSGDDARQARAPVIVERDGLKLAFLSYVDPAFTRAGDRAADGRPGIAFLDAATVAEDVASASSSDLVIVLMHAGTEYAAAPDAAQRRFAHAAVEAGADLVIGHHPHVIQPFEVHRGVPILYSLGNAVFDQGWSEATSLGLAADIRLGKEGVRRIFWRPLGIASGRPSFLDGERADRALARLGEVPEAVPAFRPRDGASLPSAVRRTTLAPAPVGSLSTVREADLDGDGSPERLELSRGKARVTSRGAEAWSSPADWWINDAVLADVMNDGRLDVTLVVWKADEDEAPKRLWNTRGGEMRQRLLVYRFVDGRMEAVATSSDFSMPLCSMTSADIDGDGRRELLVTEGESRDGSGCRPTHLAAWSWNGDGFSNRWRQEVPGLAGFDAVSDLAVPR